MTGVNFACLLGNVGQDPEVRTLGSGAKVASFSLATSESWRDRQSGERKERTEWHRVVVFGNSDGGGLTTVIAEHVRKGTKLFLRGQLRTRSYEDQAGVTRYTTEVVLSGGQGELTLCGAPGSRPPAPDGEAGYGARGGDYAAMKGRGAEPGRTAAKPSFAQDMDDEIPF